MKKLILILTFLNCINSFGQNLPPFDYKYNMDWNTYETEKVSTELIESIFETIKGNPYTELKYFIQNIDKFHLIDIDGDNRNEIVYNGFNGSEGEMILIIESSASGYQISLKVFGRIVDISNNKKPSEFIVLDYSCCGGYVTHLETFQYNSKLESFEIVKSLAKIDETVLPKTQIEPVKFKVLNEKYNLRFSPEIVTGLKSGSFDFDPIENQNIIAVYSTGDTGTAIAESIDETGRVWWFVIMDSYPDKSKSVFYKGNNKFDSYNPVGWISNRFVEKY